MEIYFVGSGLLWAVLTLHAAAFINVGVETADFSPMSELVSVCIWAVGTFLFFVWAVCMAITSFWLPGGEVQWNPAVLRLHPYAAASPYVCLLWLIGCFAATPYLKRREAILAPIRAERMALVSQRREMREQLAAETDMGGELLWQIGTDLLAAKQEWERSLRRVDRLLPKECRDILKGENDG